MEKGRRDDKDTREIDLVVPWKMAVQGEAALRKHRLRDRERRDAEYEQTDVG